MEPFQELLATDRILVVDGAMGTMLYAKGVYINRCYDELNLSNPDLVREIHSEYIRAGANVFGVDLAHQIGIAEIQFVVTAIDIDALRVEHRAHRVINDENAIGFEKFAEWLHLRTKNSAMKKAPVLNNRDFKSFEVFRATKVYQASNPSCLAGYFTWPQVALTHHVCHRCLYAACAAVSSSRSST